MSRNRTARRRPMSQINVVPYIDVTMVLLVIFMVTAPLIQQGVEVELPSAQADPIDEVEDQQQSIVVTVDRTGRYFVAPAKQPFTEDNLAAEVSARLQAIPDAPVFVRGDRLVEYGRVITAMVVLQRAGVEQVGLITEPPDDSDAAE